MMQSIKNKVLSKKGASDIVVVLIIIIIFAAVTFFVSKSVGGGIKNAGTATTKQITDVTTAAGKFANSGDYTK